MEDHGKITEIYNGDRTNMTGEIMNTKAAIRCSCRYRTAKITLWPVVNEREPLINCNQLINTSQSEDLYQFDWLGKMKVTSKYAQTISMQIFTIYTQNAKNMALCFLEDSLSSCTAYFPNTRGC